MEKSHGNFREDSGAKPFWFLSPYGGHIQLLLPPLQLLSVAPPLTDQEAPGLLSSTDNPVKREKKRFGFSSCVWCHILTLSAGLCSVCVCVSVWTTYKIKGLEKALLNLHLVHPSFSISFILSCRQSSSQPIFPTKAQPFGKGPEKTAPPLKPHIEQREQTKPTKISVCFSAHSCSITYYLNSLPF